MFNKRSGPRPCSSSHLIVSFNCSSLVNHNLPLGSARFTLWRLPSRCLMMALMRKFWRAHSKQQFVSRQVGCLMVFRICANIQKKLASNSFVRCVLSQDFTLGSFPGPLAYVVAQTRFNHSVEHYVNNPVFFFWDCCKRFALFGSVQREFQHSMSCFVLFPFSLVAMF